MTETLVGVDTQMPGPDPGDAELSAARELVRQAQAAGLSLTGPDGLLKQLTKPVIEAALDEEMSEHLGYDKHAVEGRNRGSSRNGIRSKTVLTDAVGEAAARTFCIRKFRAAAADPPGACSPRLNRRSRHGTRTVACASAHDTVVVVPWRDRIAGTVEFLQLLRRDPAARCGVVSRRL